MKYYEIKQNTKEYGLADKVFTSSHAWSEKEVLEELTKTIGVSPVKNMQRNVHVLRLLNIPDGTRKQFKKNRDNYGYYEAYQKSELNQEYLKILKKYGLVNYNSIDFVLGIGLFGVLDELSLVKINDNIRFFVKLKDTLSAADIEKVRSKEYLTEVSEVEYLQLRIEMLKSQEVAQC